MNTTNVKELFESCYTMIEETERSLKSEKLKTLFLDEERLQNILEQLCERSIMLRTTLEKLEQTVYENDANSITSVSNEINTIFDQLENLSSSGRTKALSSDNDEIKSTTVFIEITKLLITINPIILEIYSLFGIEGKKRKHPLMSILTDSCAQMNLLLLSHSIEIARLGRDANGLPIVNTELKRLTDLLNRITYELNLSIENDLIPKGPKKIVQ